MPSYIRLTGDKRTEIYALKKVGLTQKAIALQLYINPSAISRELRRNAGLRGYRPKQAGRLGHARQVQVRGPRIFKATSLTNEEMTGNAESPEKIVLSQILTDFFPYSPDRWIAFAKSSRQETAVLD